MSKWESEKEELERLINIEKVSYEEIGRRYGCSGANIKKQAQAVGIILPQRRSINPEEKFVSNRSIEDIDKKTKLYNISDEQFIEIINNFHGWQDLYVELGYSKKPSTGTKERIIRRCTSLNIKVPDKKGIKLIEESQNCGFCLNCNKPISLSKKFCNNKCQGEYKHKQQYQLILNNDESIMRANYSPKNFRDDITKEQGGVCDICKCKPEHNGKPLVFIVDHIDGNAANNRRDNLRCICPNCDSQLNTYKSKNKNGARSYYRYHKYDEETKIGK